MNNTDIILTILGVTASIASLIGLIFSMKSFFSRKKAESKLIEKLKDDPEMTMEVLAASAHPEGKDIVKPLKSLVNTLSDEDRKQIKGLRQSSAEGQANYAKRLVRKSDITDIFDKWFNTNMESLRKAICIEWGYAQKKDQLSTPLLIIGIADVLASISILHSNTVTAAILFTGGYLDRLCKENSKENITTK